MTSSEADRSNLERSNPHLYHHLFVPGPKRMLALDGGGVLGIIEVAFLEAIERLLRERFGNPRLVLADYFDLIGGTSTGAIIATGLALGMTTKQVKELYLDFAPAVFRRPSRLWGVAPRFQAKPLEQRLKAVLGERQLQSDDLVTGLAIIAKRVDTGSPWVLTNNPVSKYWNDRAADTQKRERGYIGNRRYLLRDIVRASTAAPFYFTPQRLKIVEGEPDGLFVDGAMSPHINPSLQLLMLAGMEAYGFRWPLGKDNLLLISIGCGWVRPRILLTEAQFMPPPWFASRVLQGMVWDNNVSTLKLLQWMSEPRRPWPIDTEIGTLAGDVMGPDSKGTELLRFQRYDMEFNAEWLAEETGFHVTDTEAMRLNNFVDPTIMQAVYDLATSFATQQVIPGDFPKGFDP
jgi:uncharacterized protein